MRWFMRLIRREQLERELEAEMQHHVNEEVERLRADGVPAADARRRALAAFGGLEPIREQARDARGTRWVEDLWRDVRYALRMMRRSPVFTLAALLSLAIGIGANGAIFSVADALLLRPLDVEKPSELYFLSRTLPNQTFYRFSYPALHRLQSAVSDVQFAASGATNRIQIDREEGAELATSQLVTGEWFQVLGVRAALGRMLEPDDARSPGGRPVVVLSHDFWKSRCAANPAIVGTTLRVNGTTMTVVGVAPETFPGLDVAYRVSLWAPVTMQRELRMFSNASIDDADSNQPWVTQDGIAWLTVVARVPQSINFARASSRIVEFERGETSRAAEKTKDADRRAYRLRERVELVAGAYGQSSMRDSFSQPLRVLMATVAAVLLIACANLASLLLARSSARNREFALRLSLGAGRSRLVRQLLTESLLLSATGGVAGLIVTQVGARALLSMASSGTSPVPLTLPLDWHLIGFITAISVGTGIVFGLGPALRSSRSSHGDALKAGARIAGGERRPGLFSFGRSLIVAQVALSLALLAGALLFLRTFNNLLAADTGFDQVNVVNARLDPILSGITESQLPELYTRLLERAKAIPGATKAAIALGGPVTGSARTSGILVDHEPMRVGDESQVREEFVTPDYFRTLGMTVVRGRGFSVDDLAGKTKVTVINEQMARHFFGERDPLGHHIGYDDPTDIEIIGIVRDARVDGPRADVPAMTYSPLAQHSKEFARNLYIRVSGPVEPARIALREAVTAVNPRLAVREVVTLSELTSRIVTNDRLVSRLTGIFGILAVGVACLGLYGTIAFSVVRRTNEIGVRIALGATRGGVGWMVLRETLAIVAVGCALGVAGLLPLFNYVKSLLYGLSPHDPSTLASAVIALVAIGLLAGAVPAWRASRVDPLTALRTE